MAGMWIWSYEASDGPRRQYAMARKANEGWSHAREAGDTDGKWRARDKRGRLSKGFFSGWSSRLAAGVHRGRLAFERLPSDNAYAVAWVYCSG
jgi:hypothetical protein